MARKPHSGVSDQRKASIHRWQDAEPLFAAGRWRGAVYLAGYAVECRLKYKLMRMWRCLHLKQLEEKLLQKEISHGPFTHSLKLLLRLAGGLERMQNNQALWAQFSLRVNRWEPAWRYSPNMVNKAHAQEFLAAVADVNHWIENNL